MSKRFLLILGAVFIGLGLVFWLTKDKASTPSTSSSQPTKHVIGEGKKGVTLTEYGDYQCPVCSQYYLTLKQVVAKYNSDIFFEYRNLPLVQIHQNGFAASRAAEAAGLQNKFWEMHDKLFEEQSVWSTTSSPTQYFQAYATALGLNVEKFNKDYASKTVNDLINADVSEFDKTKNQHATPTFFLDGKKVENSSLSVSNVPNLDEFSKVIDAAIATKNKN